MTDKQRPSILRRGLLIVRVALGGILTLAGGTKLAAPAKFVETLAGYRLLPAQGNHLLGLGLPWLELICGVLLVGGLWVRASGSLSATLFLLFSVATLTAIVRQLDVECGCFGAGLHPRVGSITLLGDLLGLACALVIVVGDRHPAVKQVSAQDHAGCDSAHLSPRVGYPFSS